MAEPEPEEHGRPEPPERHARLQLADSPANAADRKKKGRQNVVIILVGLLGVIVAVVAYRRQQANAASTAGTPTGIPAVGSGQVAGYGGGGTATDPYAESMLGTLTQQYQAQQGAISGFQTALTDIQNQLGQLENQKPAPPASSPATAAAAPLSPAMPFNPYPVGTIVGRGEKVVQSVLTSYKGRPGYVDVTSQGGLWTSPGLAVSGSAYSGTTGNYRAAVSGSTVYEYTPTGVRQYRLT